MEKTAICNWKIIVDRIVEHNDQQASIFLQQKLKISNSEQRIHIINCIILRAFELMINRFGNFLVQRCLEYSNKEQIHQFALAIVGSVCTLSMDPFGCHVVQKILDCVEENLKEALVYELLANVSETVTHRYACHVWQKLFELRWKKISPPPFMKKMNEELKGKWHLIAAEETGSLVVQNIFENCNKEDKKPCILEIIDNIEDVIIGQWGNWVIQHMIEHADEPYRQEVISLVVEHSPNFSTNQYASKVVEKLLKMGNVDICRKYLNRVTQKGDQRRIPLIDSEYFCFETSIHLILTALFVYAYFP